MTTDTTDERDDVPETDTEHAHDTGCSPDACAGETDMQCAPSAPRKDSE